MVLVSSGFCELYNNIIIALCTVMQDIKVLRWVLAKKNVNFSKTEYYCNQNVLNSIYFNLYSLKTTWGTMFCIDDYEKQVTPYLWCMKYNINNKYGRMTFYRSNNFAINYVSVSVIHCLLFILEDHCNWFWMNVKVGTDPIFSSFCTHQFNNLF